MPGTRPKRPPAWPSTSTSSATASGSTPSAASRTLRPEASGSDGDRPAPVGVPFDKAWYSPLQRRGRPPRSWGADARRRVRAERAALDCWPSGRPPTCPRRSPCFGRVTEEEVDAGAAQMADATAGGSRRRRASSTAPRDAQRHDRLVRARVFSARVALGQGQPGQLRADHHPGAHGEAAVLLTHNDLGHLLPELRTGRGRPALLRRGAAGPTTAAIDPRVDLRVTPEDVEEQPLEAGRDELPQEKGRATDARTRPGPASPRPRRAAWPPRRGRLDGDEPRRSSGGSGRRVVEERDRRVGELGSVAAAPLRAITGSSRSAMCSHTPSSARRCGRRSTSSREAAAVVDAEVGERRIPSPASSPIAASSALTPSAPPRSAVRHYGHNYPKGMLAFQLAVLALLAAAAAPGSPRSWPGGAAAPDRPRAKAAAHRPQAASVGLWIAFAAAGWSHSAGRPSSSSAGQVFGDLLMLASFRARKGAVSKLSYGTVARDVRLGVAARPRSSARSAGSGCSRPASGRPRPRGTSGRVSVRPAPSASTFAFGLSL